MVCINLTLSKQNTSAVNAVVVHSYISNKTTTQQVAKCSAYEYLDYPMTLIVNGKTATMNNIVKCCEDKIDNIVPLVGHAKL